jgi:selenocysteine lyase/cysteine desulfurase
MNLRNENNKNIAESHSTVDSARRDFIKLCGAAGVSGVSGFLLPQDGEAVDSLDPLASKASGGIVDNLFWSCVRRQFALKPGLVYMNTGTEGVMPRYVLSRLRKYFKEFAKNPWDSVLTHDCYCYTMPTITSAVTEFLGADSNNEIVLTTNTTEGFCLIANGLNLEEGDEILTTLHFAPYNGSFIILKERKNITVTEIELPTPAETKDEIIAAFESAITPQTKLISFCHINFTTGLRMPVKEICQLARDHGIPTLVDGAHAVGMIDLNMDDLGCDFYACSPHKWLNAPPGTGVLYMREDAQDLVWPTVTEAYIDADGSKMTDHRKVLFQMRGQQCTPVYRGLLDAIDFQNAIGKDKIQDRVMELSAFAKEMIIETWGPDSLFSPMEEELSSGLVSFNPFDDHYEKRRASNIFNTLWDRNIITRRVEFRDKLSDPQMKHALRLSTHILNSKSQIEKVLSEVETIIAAL